MPSNRSLSSRSASSRSRKGPQTNPSNTTSQTRPTTYSSKDPAFEQALIDGHYYPEGYDEIEPNNTDEEIIERLARHRASLSPSSFSRERFLEFKRKNRAATSEATVMRNVFLIILGRETMPTGENYPFNHLEPLASNVSNPKPNYFNGSRLAQVYPKVREDLGKYIIPSNDYSRPLLPNFFMEAKGPDGKASEMMLQITQDLATGARGMHKIQSYGQEQPIYDGNAYTIGSTYHKGTGTLQLYAMHPTPPVEPSGQPEYHTTQIRGFQMTDRAETFREGARAFRNAQDWAKEQRDRFITYANEVAAGQLLQQAGEGEDEEVEEDEYEDEGGDEGGDEGDEGEDEGGEEEGEEEEEDSTKLAAQYMHSFTSPSQASTQIKRSLINDIALSDSDTSTDELQRDYNPPAKRSSKPGYYRQSRKRR
jgi:hypothetical protein